MKLHEHWMLPLLLSLSSSSHDIVIIISMHLLLPLQLPFQLIGFSYYSTLLHHCGLYFLLRTILYLIRMGSARAKKEKKTRQDKKWIEEKDDDDKRIRIVLRLAAAAFLSLCQQMMTDDY